MQTSIPVDICDFVENQAIYLLNVFFSVYQNYAKMYIPNIQLLLQQYD